MPLPAVVILQWAMPYTHRGKLMTKHEDAWSGTVVKKSRALLDGSNLYRRLKVRLDDGTHIDVKADRGIWKQLEVGDRLVKQEGEDPRRG